MEFSSTDKRTTAEHHRQFRIAPQGIAIRKLTCGQVVIVGGQERAVYEGRFQNAPNKGTPPSYCRHHSGVAVVSRSLSLSGRSLEPFCRLREKHILTQASISSLFKSQSSSTQQVTTGETVRKPMLPADETTVHASSRRSNGRTRTKKNCGEAGKQPEACLNV